MPVQIVNANPKYSKVHLIEPTSLGYVYLAAAVRPGPLPVIPPSRTRAKLLRRLKELIHDVERLEGVVDATVFRGIVKPPTVRFSSYLKEHEGKLPIANFDVAALIQTTSLATAHALQRKPAYLALLSAIEARTDVVHVMTACNARRIGDVDTTRGGLFLFNHFAADDPDVMLELWEYLADWYVKETGLDNSVALVPERAEASPYRIVNWARWESGALRHFWRQLSKKAFWRYVTQNLDANHAASMPIYCRLA